MNTNRNMSIVIAIIITCFLSAINLFSQTLRLHYDFNAIGSTDSIYDETGNGYDGKVYGSAKVKQLGSFGILEIGETTGYVDLGTQTGNLITTLSNFSVSTYLYIDPSKDLTGNGNFVWVFSNAENILTSPTGCMFYSAKESRYAICTTDYSTEKAVSIGSAATKGEWIHIAYTQSSNTGRIYIDGALMKTVTTITTKPINLGATSYNYLARPCYAGDAYLLKSKMCDFRVYDGTLTAGTITTLAANTDELDTLIYTDLVDTALYNLSLGDLSAVTSNITLPTADGDITISWSSSNTSTITNGGVVTRPAMGQPNINVTLTATLTKGFISKTKDFYATVLAMYDDSTIVVLDSTNLELEGNLNNLRSNLDLLLTGDEGSTITWSSDNPIVLNDLGEIINRPLNGDGNTEVILTATITKGAFSTTKSFTISVAEDEGFAGYLFAYFTGNTPYQEQIRFAISYDGYVYKALNSDNPIISSDTISIMGGVRDPHILRGEDGNFYMVVTDMRSELGWSSNYGIVMLKSSNLTNWEHATVDFHAAFPEYVTADRVWAPQTIYDPIEDKYMVYLSIRVGGDYDKICYAYANGNFNSLTTPQQLYYEPGNNPCIDGDMVYFNEQYHLFYKTESGTAGITKAVSSSINSSFVQDGGYRDQTTEAVEGGCVFRLYNTDDWIFMYDMYATGQYQFTISDDLDNFSVVTGNSFDFTPRHGTIIPVTAHELIALLNKWGVGATNQLDSLSAIDDSIDLVLVGNLDSVITNLTLPTTGNQGSTITWSSSNPSVLDNSGVVTRPSAGSGNASVVLTATITKNGYTSTRTFYITVIQQDIITGFDNTANAQIRIFINSETNELHICGLIDFNGVTADIYNLQGMKLISKTVQQPTMSINGLNQGVYIVKIEKHNTNLGVYKFINL